MDINTFLDIAQIKNIDPSKLTSINKEFLYHKIIKILTNFYKYNKLTFNEWVDLVSQAEISARRKHKNCCSQSRQTLAHPMDSMGYYAPNYHIHIIGDINRIICWIFCK